MPKKDIRMEQEATQARLIDAMKPVAAKLSALWVHPGVKGENRIAEKQQRNRNIELTDIVRGSLVVRDPHVIDEAIDLLQKRASSKPSTSKLSKYFTLEEKRVNPSTYVRKVLLRDRVSHIIAEIQLHTCQSFWLTHIATHGPYEIRRRLPPTHACRSHLVAAEKKSLAPRNPDCLKALKTLVDKDGALLLQIPKNDSKSSF